MAFDNSWFSPVVLTEEERNCILFGTAVRTNISHRWYYNQRKRTRSNYCRHRRASFTGTVKESHECSSRLVRAQSMTPMGSECSVHADDVIGRQDVNLVDVEQVMAGRDTRSTLMIKRLPRKYILSSLSAEINNVMRSLFEVLPVIQFDGKEALLPTLPRDQVYFDLLYVPMDAGRSSNRGYAFINMRSPILAAYLFMAFNDRPWSMQASSTVPTGTIDIPSTATTSASSVVAAPVEKRAQVVFADIQGKEATLFHIFNQSNNIRTIPKLHVTLFLLEDHHNPTHVQSEVPLSSPVVFSYTQEYLLRRYRNGVA